MFLYDTPANPCGAAKEVASYLASQVLGLPKHRRPPPPAISPPPTSLASTSSMTTKTVCEGAQPQLRIDIIMKCYFSGTQKSSIWGVWTAPGAPSKIKAFWVQEK
jgi:hypothetical protein